MNVYEAYTQAKAQRPDLLLTPDEARTLLEAHGWALHEKNPRPQIALTFFKGDQDGEDFRVVDLPLRTDFVDFDRRMSEVMFELAQDVGLTKNDALRAVVLGLVK